MQTTPPNYTGLTVSRACSGTMTFGAQADESESRLMLDYTLDAGINLIDTANIYAKGASEEILGRLLRGRRHEIVLASKVRGAMGSGPLDGGLSRAAMEKALENTSRRLQTDYLAIYYLHPPDYDVARGNTRYSGRDDSPRQSAIRRQSKILRVGRYAKHYGLLKKSCQPGPTHPAHVQSAG